MASSVTVSRGVSAPARTSPGGRVELQVTHREAGASYGGRPALQSPQAGQQLTEVERLDQVVVGALVQAGDPVAGAVPGREHQHG